MDTFFQSIIAFFTLDPSEPISFVGQLVGFIPLLLAFVTFSLSKRSHILIFRPFECGAFPSAWRGGRRCGLHCKHGSRLRLLQQGQKMGIGDIYSDCVQYTHPAYHDFTVEGLVYPFARGWVCACGYRLLV